MYFKNEKNINQNDINFIIYLKKKYYSTKK